MDKKQVVIPRVSTEKEKKQLFSCAREKGYAKSNCIFAMAARERFYLGDWPVAQSPIFRTTITVKRLKMKGSISLVEYYKKDASLSNRQVRVPYAWWC